MVNGLNHVFEQLQCSEIINHTTIDIDDGKYITKVGQHITLEEMFRTETQNRDRMQALTKNEQLIWPDEFSTPGFFWGHQYKQSNQ